MTKLGTNCRVQKTGLNAYNQYSQSVQASQECGELSVKILSLLKVDYPAAHGWTTEQLLQIAKQIQDKHLLPGSPQDLFGKEEADLAVHHAEECYRAALQLRYLDQSKIAVLVS